MKNELRNALRAYAFAMRDVMKARNGDGYIAQYAAEEFIVDVSDMMRDVTDHDVNWD